MIIKGWAGIVADENDNDVIDFYLFHLITLLIY